MQQSEKQNDKRSRLHNRTSLHLLSLFLLATCLTSFRAIGVILVLEALVNAAFSPGYFFKLSKYKKHSPFSHYLDWELKKISDHMKGCL